MSLCAICSQENSWNYENTCITNICLLQTRYMQHIYLIQLAKKKFDKICKFGNFVAGVVKRFWFPFVFNAYYWIDCMLLGFECQLNVSIQFCSYKTKTKHQSCAALRLFCTQFSIYGNHRVIASHFPTVIWPMLYGNSGRWHHSQCRNTGCLEWNWACCNRHTVPPHIAEFVIGVCMYNGLAFIIIICL